MPVGMTWPATEADLARVVVEYLIAMGWDVYQEVVWTRGRADIVGVKGSLVWVVETKKTLGLDLLAQGTELRPWVSLVSLAFPAPPKAHAQSRSRRFAISVAEREGMGLLQIRDPARFVEGAVKELAKPKLNRKPLEDLRAKLEPEHRTFAAAGNADCKFWSPFKRTAARLRHYVETNPGVSLKQAIADIEHHYSTPDSAAGSLRSLIEAGAVAGVEIRKPARGPWRLYPSDWPEPVVELQQAVHGEQVSLMDRMQSRR